MADYIYIDNLTNNGKLAISRLAIDSIASFAVSLLPGISKSASRLKKNQNYALNRPVRTSIHNGVAHIHLALDVRKELNLTAVKKDVSNAIKAVLNAFTEQVPYVIDFVITKRL